MTFGQFFDHGVEVMLAERVKEWTREWKEEGIQQGRHDAADEVK